MMVTTGGRGTSCPAVSSLPVSTPAASLAADSSKVMTWVSAPNCRAISRASSASSVWLTVAITPRASNREITSLARTPTFSARVLYADALGDGDVAADGQRLRREVQARRRHEALHRTFFDAAGNVTLSGTPCRRRTSRRTRGRRRQARSYSQRTGAGGRLPRGMHGTTLAGSQGSRGGRCGARTLENRLARNRVPWGCPALRGRVRTRWLLRRCLVDGPRAGLRHDHAPQRSRRSRRRCRLGRMCLCRRRRSFRGRRNHSLWGCSRSCWPGRGRCHHNFGRRRR